MSELTLLLLRIGFLLLLWFFVFSVVYSLRADLFGTKVRKLPAPQTATAGSGGNTAAAASATKATAPVVGASPRSGTAKPEKATTASASRIVITSGPKSGLEITLGTDPLTIGRSSESGLVIRDDYTSSHHARLVLWGDQWMLQDLDSTNGTWHDGARVSTPVPIMTQTPLKVGATTFELRK